MGHKNCFVKGAHKDPDCSVRLSALLENSNERKVETNLWTLISVLSVAVFISFHLWEVWGPGNC